MYIFGAKRSRVYCNLAEGHTRRRRLRKENNSFAMQNVDEKTYLSRGSKRRSIVCVCFFFVCLFLCFSFTSKINVPRKKKVNWHCITVEFIFSKRRPFRDSWFVFGFVLPVKWKIVCGTSKPLLRQGRHHRRMSSDAKNPSSFFVFFFSFRSSIFFSFVFDF